MIGQGGSKVMDMECSIREKALPFRSATGAHMECGHLFLIYVYEFREFKFMKQEVVFKRNCFN